MSPLADWQFWVDAQSEVILTTHVGTGVSFITACMAYVSTSKTKLFKLRQSTFLPGADVPHVYVLPWCCFHSLTTTQTFWRMLTLSVDGCVEIKNASLVA